VSSTTVLEPRLALARNAPPATPYAFAPSWYGTSAPAAATIGISPEGPTAALPIPSTHPELRQAPSAINPETTKPSSTGLVMVRARIGFSSVLSYGQQYAGLERGERRAQNQEE
jgi:hypothetical protein